MDTIVARKEFFKKFSRGHALVIVKIHVPRCIEKAFDILPGYFELLLQDACEILPIISCSEGELGIVKSDSFELNNHVGNFGSPVFTTGFNHAHWKSVEGDIEAGAVTCELSGSSTIDLDGSADDLTVKASGGSIVKLSEFPAANANIEASGASTVTVNVDGTINANVSGASRVYYVGNPTLGTVDTSGAASISPK